MVDVGNVQQTSEQPTSDQIKSVSSRRVWTTLITNLAYLPGLLALDFSLKRVKSQYTLVVLYTDAFPLEGHRALEARGIPKKHVEYLLPNVHKDFSNDPRFYDCWSKLTPFSLTEYDRVVQLDSDMIVLQNMDELMDIELDPPELAGKGNRVFAASHACVCNPLRKAHYPKDWIAENCAFTSQHSKPDDAQIHGAPPTAGLAMPNGGLQVVNPSSAVYSLILSKLGNETSTSDYSFADQSLLSDLFHGRWVTIPYVYNALRPMRWQDVHGPIWRDERVKNLHLLLGPKPWEGKPEADQLLAGRPDETAKWWWTVNLERLAAEKQSGIEDEFSH